MVDDDTGAQFPESRGRPDSHETAWVVVASFTAEFEARIAEGALQAGGVPAMVLKDDEGGMGPPLAFSRGIQILVGAEDVSRAREILSRSG